MEPGAGDRPRPRISGATEDGNDADEGLIRRIPPLLHHADTPFGLNRGV